MPTYDYHCKLCAHEFTSMHKMSDPIPVCPNCGGEPIRKVSAPAVHGGAGRGDQAGSTAPTHGCAAGACGCRH